MAKPRRARPAEKETATAGGPPQAATKHPAGELHRCLTPWTARLRAAPPRGRPASEKASPPPAPGREHPGAPSWRRCC
eukprot:7904825-Pyramimonas_sp.AAC.1